MRMPQQQSRLIGFVLMVVVMAVPRTALAAVSYTAKNLTSQGNSLYAKADYAGALKKYEAALADSPNYDVALNNKGLALIRLVRLNEAMASIRQAIQINSFEKRYYLNLAKACAHADQLTTAIAHLNTAIVFDAAYKEAYYNRGWCWDALGQNTAAVNDYLKALAQDETYTAPKIGIGIVWARRNNMKLATWWLLRAIASSNTKNSDTMIHQLAHRDLRIARGDEAVFWKAESADVLTSGIRCLERQQYTRAATYFKALKDKEYGAALSYDYLVRAMTLAHTTDTAAVTSLINLMNFNLISYQLNATPAGSTVGINYRAEGASPKSVYLFPGNHYYFARSGSRLGFADRRDAFFLNLDTSATADLKKIVTGSSFGNIPNAVQIGVTESIDLRKLMHVVAARQQNVFVADDFKDTNIKVEPISGFFGNCESVCTATLSCSAGYISIQTKTATFTGSNRAFRLAAGAGLESHPEPIELTLDWTSEISAGSVRITLDPDFDDDGLIDTLEAAHGCDVFKTDTDADGIPDGWELYRGLNAVSPHDADDDLDRDGLPNYGEWLIGSDPRDPASPASVYVDGNTGDDDGGNGSVVHPFRTIEKALTAGGNPVAIRISKGAYPEKLTLRNGLALIGSGYDCGTTITASGSGRAISVPEGASVVIKDLAVGGGQLAANEHGAGIKAEAGSRLYLYHMGIIGNRTYSGSSSGFGAGLHIEKGTLRMVRSVVSDNYSTASGGGIFANNTATVLLHSLFTRNSTILYVNAGSLYARNLTFVKNQYGMNFYNTTPVITNCIFWGNGYSLTSSCNLSYTCFDSARSDIVTNGVKGNLIADAKFVDPANYDYHLAAGSPCIDSGTMQGPILSDLEEMALPQGSGIERGCYEYNPGLRDHNKIIRYLLGYESNPAGLDFNSDKQVDIADAVKKLGDLLPGMPIPLSPADGETNVSGAPRLSWKPAPYAGSYNVYLWRSQETTPTTPTISGITATSWVPPVLSYYTLYRWRVVACNGSLQTVGPVAKFTTRSQSVMVMAPNLVARWTRGVNESVRYWADLSKAGGQFRIELWKGGKKVMTLVPVSNNTSGNKTETVVAPTTLTPGGGYKVRVISIKLESAGAGVDAWDESNFEFTIG